MKARPSPVAHLPASAGALVLGALSALACTRAASPIEKNTATSAVATSAAPSPALARWVHQPSGRAIVQRAVQGDRCVLLLEDGERVLTAPAVATGSCGPFARAAEDPSPEGLRGLASTAEGRWMFLATGGRAYEAEAPLAPFARALTVPSDIVAIAGGEGAILARTRDYRIVRLGAGPPVGAIAEPVLDVAADGRGRALALTFPERLLASEDGGATWVVAPGGPFGGSRVTALPGALAAEGRGDRRVWPRSEPMTSLAAVRADPAREETYQVIQDARDVLEGRATLDGSRYCVVSNRSVHPDAPLLACGAVEGALAAEPGPPLAGCAVTAVAVQGPRHALLCERDSRPEDALAARCAPEPGGTRGKGGKAWPSACAATAVELWLKDGSTWGRRAVLAGSPHARHTIALAPDGSMLVGGACPARASRCEPDALTLVGPAGVEALVTVEGERMSRASAPVFAADGAAAFFAGRAGGDAALFASRDGGRTFAPRRIPVTRDLQWPYPAAPVSIERGVVGVVARDGERPVYVTMALDGGPIRVASAPEAAATLAGAGLRALAFASSARGARAWESSDGGASWREVPGPRSWRNASLLPPGMVCGAAGCILDGGTTRLGWGDGESSPPTLPAPPELPSSARRRASRTPIVCTTRGPWTPIANALEPVSLRATRPVALDTLAIGRAAWSVVTFSSSRKAVGVVAAVAPEGDAGEVHVEKRTLLGPTSAHAAMALAGAYDSAGHVAVRVPLRGLGKPLRDVEVAWIDWAAGTSGRATIPEMGRWEPNDVDEPEGRFSVRFATLVHEGVVVRPHDEYTRDAPAYRVDAQGHVEVVAWPWARADDEGVVVSDQSLVPFQVSVRGAREVAQIQTAGHATGGAPGWDLSVMTLAALLDHGARRHLELEVHASGGAAVLSVALADPAGPFARTYALDVGSDGTLGAPRSLPTWLDLGARPRPCSASERRNTLRLVARAFGRGSVDAPGTLHPVVVTEDGASLVLLSDGGIVHGNVASPCAAALHAVGIGKGDVEAVVLGDLAQAWLFRRKGLAFRVMSCQWDERATVPEAVWSEPGMTVEP
jgi:hypothetical protein